MHIRFKTIDGQTVDVFGNLVQLIDNGPDVTTYDEGDRLRYQVMVGEKGWCYLITAEEYDRLREVMCRPASTE